MLQVTKIGRGRFRVQHLPSKAFFDAGFFSYPKHAQTWLDKIKPLANWDLATVEEIKADKPTLLQDLRDLAGISPG